MSGLGRHFKFDSRDYPVTRAANAPTPTATLPAHRTWSGRGLPNNQGDTPRCVGYSARGELSAGPVIEHGGPSADDIYWGARQADPIPEPDGATGRGAMAFLQAQGCITAYVWPQTADEVMAWVLANGPCLLGINWYDSFDQPPASGVLRLPDTASIRGGHEILVIGADRTRGLLRLINSWGPRYGMHGRVWMPLEVLARLLNEDGDCAAPTDALVPA